MKTEEAIVLIGGGGHCRSCIDVIEEEGKYAIAGIVVRDHAHREEVPGYEIIGTDADLPRLVKEYPISISPLARSVPPTGGCPASVFLRGWVRLCPSSCRPTPASPAVPGPKGEQSSCITP